MIFCMGMWINSMSTAVADIVPFIIFSLIVVVVVFKVIYDFHKSKAEDGVY